MRYLLFGFLMLLAAIWLGLWISQDPGYVLISYNHWSAETSLWIGLVILLLSFIAFYIVLRILSRISSLPERFARWQRSRRFRKARILTNFGICQLMEGHWQRAEKTLNKAAVLTAYPLVDYLGAARAASLMNNTVQRDHYLTLAMKSTKGSEIAVSLTQAQLQIGSQQWEQALATLKHVLNLNPQHRLALTLLQKVYLELKDYCELEKMLPALEKHSSLTEKEYLQLCQLVYFEQLKLKTKQGAETLIDYWDALPRQWRHNIDLQICYAQQLLVLHQDNVAVQFIERELKRNWDARLLILFGDARSQMPAKQLKIAENWYQQNSTDAVLLLTLGKLANHEKFWGKAADYLQKSVAIKPSKAAYFLLGQVYESLHQSDEALKAYRLGLGCA